MIRGALERVFQFASSQPIHVARGATTGPGQFTDPSAGRSGYVGAESWVPMDFVHSDGPIEGGEMVVSSGCLVT